MKNQLAQTLAEKGLLNQGSKITAKCPITAMGHAPAEAYIPLIVNKVEILNEVTIFHSVTKEGRRYKISSEDISMIDGMEPERLAAAFDIKPDGGNKPAGKKRGRKPKAK